MKDSLSMRSLNKVFTYSKSKSQYLIFFSLMILVKTPWPEIKLRILLLTRCLDLLSKGPLRKSFWSRIYCCAYSCIDFKKERIVIETFFAPNHTYDKNTFNALKKFGINEVIDGYGLMPYKEMEIKFIPQLFYKVYALPFGIQATQIHLNYWKDKDFQDFENFIRNKLVL